MTIPAFTPTENYLAFRILRQSQLNALAASVKTQFDTYTKLNFTQIGLDVFGNTYDYNNDGLQSVATPLIDLVGQLAENETVTGSWTFSGSTAFSSPVTSTSTFTSSGQMRSRAYVNPVAQVIPTAAITALNYAAETYDVGSMHDNTVNPSRITIPTGGSGIYIFHGQVNFAASAVGRRDVYIYKNGSKIATAIEFAPDAAVTSTVQINCHDSCSVNDFFEIKVFQDTGGNLDVNAGERTTFFSAIKVW